MNNKNIVFSLHVFADFNCDITNRLVQDLPQQSLQNRPSAPILTVSKILPKTSFHLETNVNESFTTGNF